ncbi:MAG: hypothetical protein IT548_06365 [Alphaproteobacteria bacterium]|nr:hypothetical protein [Alphaproteobacteria bacterium]
MPKPLRIFISSPGDVSAERRRAALVVESLKKEFARFFDISAYLWEHEAMLATGHFQDVIEPPSQSDIVVLILWSRLGTPLPEKSAKREYRGLDGRAPVTGTEWEYEDALAANRSKGAPDLLVYRSNKEPQISLRDPAKKALAEGQWSALESFWSRYFQAGGVFLSAYHGFDDLEDFGDMLEAHLRQLIRTRIERGRIEAGSDVRATWLQSPFRGLSSYEFEHAPIFFGRGAAQLKAVEQLVHNANGGRAFLLVLGASGSGKSSLVRAGLLPNLFARGVADGAGLWRRVIFKPGDADGNLFKGVARTLAEDRVREGVGLPEILGPGLTVEDLEKALRRSIDDPGFVFTPALGKVTAEARATGKIMAHESAKLALVLDQLEEIFTDGSISTEERNTFIRLVASLARTGQVWVIATMRSDFWHRAAATPELVALAEGLGRMDLLPPSQAELAEMIRRPAAAAGLSFEDHAETRIALDAMIAEEAARDPGSLPLVSFVLDALYKTDVERGKGQVLTYGTYNALGGLKGAIATRADEILAAQPADVQAALPSLLRALVTVDSERDRNATARMAPLAAFPPGSPRRALADAFLDPTARLLIADGDGGEARIRVAHEALINHWARAREQINRDRRDLETRARLEEDEALWRAAPANEKLERLLDGLALEEGKDLVGKWGDELPQSLKDFIEESRKVSSRKRNRRFRIAMGVAAAMAVLAVGAVILGIWAMRQSAIAEAESTRAVAAEAQTDAQLKETQRGTARLIYTQSVTASANGFPELGMLLASEAIRVAKQSGQVPTALIAALQYGSANDTVISVFGDVDDPLGDADFGADAATVFTGGNDGRLTVWDTFSGTERMTYGTNDAHLVTALADWLGQYIAVAYTDKTVEIYDYKSLNRIGGAITFQGTPTAMDMDGNGRLLVAADDTGAVRFLQPSNQTQLAEVQAAHTGQVASIDIAENLSIAVSADGGGTAVVWDLATYTKRATVTHGDASNPTEVEEVVVSPRGDQFALIGRGWASIFDAQGQPLKTLIFDDVYLYRIVYSPDGNSLIYSAGKNATMLSTKDFSVQRVFSGHTFDVRGLELSRDGKRLLTASGDNTLRLWNVDTGSTLRLFRSPKGSIAGQGLSRDGNYVTATFDDGLVVVWAVEGLTPSSVRQAHTWNINSIAWNKDGSEILTSAGDGSAMLTDADSSMLLFAMKPGGAGVYNAVFTPDGKQIVMSDDARQVKIFSATTGDEVRTLTTLEDGWMPYWVAVTPDGKQVAVATYGGVRIYDYASGAQVKLLAAPNTTLFSMGMSPDGKYVAGGASDGRLLLWDLQSGALLAELREHSSTINSVNFSPDSKSLVTAASDRTVRVWDVATATQKMLLAGHRDIALWAAFSPDGQRVISAGFDETIRVWDPATGAELSSVLGPGRVVRTAMFSPDGKRIAAGGDDHKIYIWNVPDKTFSNTQTGAPMLGSQLQGDNEKLMSEMIDWAPLSIARLIPASERQAYFLAPDPVVRIFDTQPDLCDLLAAYQSDPQRRTPGVREGWINVADAEPACRAAVAQNPGEPRFHMQLARTIIASGAQQDGTTAPDKKTEALKELQPAIDAGYPGAIYYRAFLLADARNNTADEMREGVELARKAWTLGVPDAGDLIAKAQLDGLKAKDNAEIVKQDQKAAIETYKEAAEKGSWFASINLAFQYEYGRKDMMEADRLQALYYFALAARQVEVEGFAESTEVQRARYLFARRATLVRSLVREGKSTEVAEIARKIAAWRPGTAATAAPQQQAAAE